MEFWDTAITIFIVVLAGLFLLKNFLRDDGCNGCSGGCEQDSSLDSSRFIKDKQPGKNQSDCSGCSCTRK